MTTQRLTAKQEKFVCALVSGVSQYEAYRAAYDCEGHGREYADSKASHLMSQVKMRARYAELVAEIASRVLWDRERATRELLEVRAIALDHIRQTVAHRAHFDANDKRDIADLPKTAVQLVIASTAELNKMFRVNEANDGDGRVTVVDDV